MPHNVDDLRRILSIRGQGNDILLKPQGDQPFFIRCMFDIKFYDRDLGGHKLKTSEPYFVALKDDIRRLGTSDAVVYGDQIYYVSSINDDGHGVVKVELREEYEPTREDKDEVADAEEYIASIKRKNPGTDRS